MNQTVMEDALRDVARERFRQEELHGEVNSCANPNLSPHAKLAILMEEVGEVARDLCECIGTHRSYTDNLRVELIQVAAVAVAWAESL